MYISYCSFNNQIAFDKNILISRFQTAVCVSLRDWAGKNASNLKWTTNTKKVISHVLSLLPNHHVILLFGQLHHVWFLTVL